MKTTGKLALLAALGVLAGCATKQHLVPLDVGKCPVPPSLPVVMETELGCFSDGAYQRLVERELRLREHIGALEVFCGEDDER